jgi:hypothetical protein
MDSKEKINSILSNPSNFPIIATLDSPYGNANVIRTPLNALERYRLEEQFNNQVPEYREVGQRKHTVLKASYATGVVLGAASGFYTWKTSHRFLVGAFAFLLGTVGTKFLCQSVYYLPSLSRELQLREYDRAFNIWLFYKEQNENKNLPIRTMEQRYQERLRLFREKLLKEELEGKRRQQVKSSEVELPKQTAAVMGI